MLRTKTFYIGALTLNLFSANIDFHQNLDYFDSDDSNPSGISDADNQEVTADLAAHISKTLLSKDGPQGPSRKLFKGANSTYKLGGPSLYELKNTNSLLKICSRKAAETEMKVQSKVGDHTNILQSRSVGEKGLREYGPYGLKPNNGAFVMKKFGSDLLHSYRNKIRNSNTRLQALSINFQIMRSLSKLRSEGILHLDVKPENVLLKYGQVKLADFEFSAFQDKGAYLINWFRGTMSYIHPQLMFNFLNYKTPFYIEETADEFSAGLLVANIWADMEFNMEVLIRSICDRYQVQSYPALKSIMNDPRCFHWATIEKAMSAKKFPKHCKSYLRELLTLGKKRKPYELLSHPVFDELYAAVRENPKKFPYVRLDDSEIKKVPSKSLSKLSFLNRI